MATTMKNQWLSQLRKRRVCEAFDVNLMLQYVQRKHLQEFAVHDTYISLRSQNVSEHFGLAALSDYITAPVGANVPHARVPRGNLEAPRPLLADHEWGSDGDSDRGPDPDDPANLLFPQYSPLQGGTATPMPAPVTPPLPLPPPATPPRGPAFALPEPPALSLVRHSPEVRPRVPEDDEIMFKVVSGAPNKPKVVPVPAGVGRKLQGDDLAVTVHRVIDRDPPVGQIVVQTHPVVLGGNSSCTTGVLSQLGGDPATLARTCTSWDVAGCIFFFPALDTAFLHPKFQGDDCFDGCQCFPIKAYSVARGHGRPGRRVRR